MTKFLIFVFIVIEAVSIILVASGLEKVAIWFIVVGIFLLLGIIARMMHAESKRHRP